MNVRPFSEGRRQFLHMAMGGFALALRFLTWWQAAALAAAALAFNLFVLPHIGKGLYRPSDARFAAGIILYPLAVLVLVMCFPRRPDIVAAAWGILAAGDGMATLAGRAMPIARLPWNPDKSYGGLLAFVLCGGAAAIALAMWTAPAVTPVPGFMFLVAAPLAAAIVAGLVETIPVGLDDNLRVPAAAAIVLGSAAVIDPDRARAVALGGAALAVPFVANAAVAAAGWLARTVTLPGALAGFLIGVVVWIGTGWQGWVLLFAAFAIAVITTKLGGKRKALLGIAEERGGRRGAGNAVANTGVAGWIAGIAALSMYREPAMAAFVAALVAGSSDTVSSEIGKAYGRRTWLVTTLRPVAAGTSGAVSSEGTAAGAIAAVLLAALAAALGLVPSSLIIPIGVAAVVAAMVESVLGSTLEPRGLLNNDLLNFITTSVAAVLGVAAWRLFA
ncbi:MAG TPA: DUF92 domain-containing protein [Vicinamibacterales bacterium]|nr:DUF92 domain-containing protein [Vicinamibacterales bacterium]